MKKLKQSKSRNAKLMHLREMADKGAKKKFKEAMPQLLHPKDR